MKTNLWGMGLEELTVWVRNNNWPSFRAKQICDYLYKRHIISFDEMKQLPQIMRTWLAENACVEKPIIVNQILSLIHISEPTRLHKVSRMPSSA